MCFFNFLLLGLREVFLYLPLRMGVLNQVVLIGRKVFGSELGTPVRTATESEAVMSHHLDSPIARQDVRLDITDLYVCRGETGPVFAINVCHSIAGAPAVFGFAEWNGRSLTDNAPNVMFSIAANTPVRLGIGKESVTSKPSKAFPYVPAVPNAHGN
jgi:hypothetical protein